MTFADFAKDHQLTPDERSELVHALAVVRGGCGSVSNRKFKRAELLDALRVEAFRQEQAGAKTLSEILDCAHNELLAKYIADHERETWRRNRNR